MSIEMKWRANSRTGSIMSISPLMALERSMLAVINFKRCRSKMTKFHPTIILNSKFCRTTRRVESSKRSRLSNLKLTTSAIPFAPFLKGLTREFNRL